MNREISLKASIIIVLLSAFIFRSLTFVKPLRLGGYDEHAYLLYTKTLGVNGVEGIRKITNNFYDDQRINLGPLPLRIFFIYTAMVSCKIWGGYNLRNLALVSYFSGILTVLMSLLFFRKIFGSQTALLASIFIIFSPLANALSGRALADSLFAFIIVLSFYFYHQYWNTGRIRNLFIFCGCVLAGLLTKESMVLTYFCYLASGVYYCLNGKEKSLWKSSVLGLAITSFLFFLIELWISGGIKNLFETYARYFEMQKYNIWAIKFHRGQWFRFILDYLLLSPAVLILAIVGALADIKNNQDEQGRNICLVYFLSGLVIFSLILTKNVRYVLFLDVFLRVFAVIGMFYLLKRINCSFKIRRFLALAFVLSLLFFDGYQFVNIFSLHKVYDPITAELIKANGFFNQ